MIGGAFLCFEGFEKIAHSFLHGKKEDDGHALKDAFADPAVDLVAFEKDRIKGAIRTDFILSAEIIVITLGTVAAEQFMTRVVVLTGIALLMTVGVYGLVAGIVKLDDAGLWLCKSAGSGVGRRMRRAVGAAILAAAPWLMKSLSIAGMAAMFLVGGGILVHGVPVLHHWVEHLDERFGGVAGEIVAQLANAGVGILAGAIVLLVVTLAQKAARRTKAAF
jgi:predicted DNA repair protein MutK